MKIMVSGTGKTHTIQIVRDSMFLQKSQTQFYHYISTPSLFPHQKDELELRKYRTKLHSMIQTAVKNCPHAVFVIEEAHLMNVKLLEGLRPFFDSVESVEGVDYRKAVFVLVSNIGFEGLVDLAHNYYLEVCKLRKLFESQFHCFSTA